MASKPILVENLDLDGLKLNGKEPLPAGIKEFFQTNNADIEKQNGFLKLSGKYFSLSKAKWEAFIKMTNAIKDGQDKRLKNNP